MMSTGMQVQYKTSWGELKREEPWLTKGQQLRIGVTSGASTPDRDVEDVLDRVFRIMVPDYSGIASKEVGAPPKPTH
jgi:4-hydroxy-3-methylbut-2-enyl diphosphate reductase